MTAMKQPRALAVERVSTMANEITISAQGAPGSGKSLLLGKFMRSLRALGIECADAMRGEEHRITVQMTRAGIDALCAEPPKHRIIEAANTLTGCWALTIQWPDGTETVEIVSDEAASLLGYAPEEEPKERRPILPEEIVDNIE